MKGEVDYTIVVIFLSPCKMESAIWPRPQCSGSSEVFSNSGTTIPYGFHVEAHNHRDQSGNWWILELVLPRIRPLDRR